ncbi:hypothetical protein R6U77_12010 [Lysinibacillus louembei]|uniref:Transposase n=1 Tax=Lysinibacillus louembei TaxID=1470088 RepID=A0ABZ0RTG9_9BACI|nr:hypothetical protein [Lysinibacillus louembei]WPK10606.1 hypothetical protein R6U77_12010 [Lysinibacillus louembei]
MGKIKWKTQVEIDEEKNAPKPLTQEERIHELEQENKLLKAQNTALVQQTEFHEEVLTEIILALNS